jgi:hypothetical protein
MEQAPLRNCWWLEVTYSGPSKVVCPFLSFAHIHDGRLPCHIVLPFLQWVDGTCLLQPLSSQPTHTYINSNARASLKDCFTQWPFLSSPWHLPSLSSLFSRWSSSMSFLPLLAHTTASHTSPAPFLRGSPISLVFCGSGVTTRIMCILRCIGCMDLL